MVKRGNVQRMRSRGARTLVLPEDVREVLAHLTERVRFDTSEQLKRPASERIRPESIDELDGYLAALFVRGWPAAALGDAAGMHRSRAHARAKRHLTEHSGQEQVIAYPLPMPPAAPRQSPTAAVPEADPTLPPAAEQRLAYMASIASTHRTAHTDGNPRITEAVSIEFENTIRMLYDAGYPLRYLASVTGMSKPGLRGRIYRARAGPRAEIPGPWDMQTAARARLVRGSPRHQGRPRQPGIYRERLATMDTTKAVMLMVTNQHSTGVTWQEVAQEMGWHHGQASGILSKLHADGRLARLAEQREGCSIYVTPAATHGRPTVEARSNQPNEAARRRVEVFLTAAQSLATPPTEIVVAGYSKRQGGQIRATLSLADIAAAIR